MGRLGARRIVAVPGWPASTQPQISNDNLKEFGPGLAAAFEGAARETSLRQFDMTEIDQLLSRKGTNVWVPWARIREASLRGGLTTGRLRITLADRKSVKFLWMRERRVFAMLRDRLLELLGPAALRLG